MLKEFLLFLKMQEFQKRKLYSRVSYVRIIIWRFRDAGIQGYFAYT